ncbi:MAG: zinc-ribbon domain-containing protein [Lachnospiraceae bacterium]|nr:zinc-ribbon domain-containing protein [Lachnospiraceae bacterium]
MKCRKCGAEIPDQALVCGHCGTSVEPYDSQEQRRREQEAYRNNNRAEERFASAGCARASLILGILSIVSITMPYITIILSLAAIAFGVLGSRSRRRGQAIAGIVLGVIMLVTGMVFLVCLSALAPYEEELANLFYDYLNSYTQ